MGSHLRSMSAVQPSTWHCQGVTEVDVLLGEGGQGQRGHSLPARCRTAVPAEPSPNPESLLGPCWGDLAKAEPSSWGSRAGAERCQVGTHTVAQTGPGARDKAWTPLRSLCRGCSQFCPIKIFSSSLISVYSYTSCCWVPATKALERSGGEAAETGGVSGQEKLNPVRAF